MLFPLLWLLMMGGMITTLVFTIVYGMRANRGEWSDCPIIGRWARRPMRRGIFLGRERLA